MYPQGWHDFFGDKTGVSAHKILPSLLALFDVHSVLELGCGNAHWTKAAVINGLSDYVVVDGEWNDREHLMVDAARFVEHDLTQPMQLGRRFDMAICLEVAEHVPPEFAELVVQTLTQSSDVILFGAAIPLQGGYGHVNEQWPSWWCEKFEAQGYRAFDLVRPKHWMDQSIHYWYRQNILVYVNQTNRAKAEAAKTAEREALSGKRILYDAVHPEKYDEMASYRAIAGKRLAKQLPNWLLSRFRAKLRMTR